MTRIVHTCLLRKSGPYNFASLEIYIRVVDREVDSTLECGIKTLNAVGREDHDTLNIFELAEKNGYKGIPANFHVVPFLKEDISFVKQ